MNTVEDSSGGSVASHGPHTRVRALSCVWMPIVYHLVQKKLWDGALANNQAYRPPTYEQDGFIHLSADASLLIDIGNTFYTSVEGDFELLCIDTALLPAGELKYEAAAPVGQIPAHSSSENPLFPHLYGFLLPSAVEGTSSSSQTQTFWWQRATDRNQHSDQDSKQFRGVTNPGQPVDPSLVAALDKLALTHPTLHRAITSMESDPTALLTGSPQSALAAPGVSPAAPSNRSETIPAPVPAPARNVSKLKDDGNQSDGSVDSLVSRYSKRQAVSSGPPPSPPPLHPPSALPSVSKEDKKASRPPHSEDFAFSVPASKPFPETQAPPAPPPPAPPTPSAPQAPQAPPLATTNSAPTPKPPAEAPRPSRALGTFTSLNPRPRSSSVERSPVTAALPADLKSKSRLAQSPQDSPPSSASTSPSSSPELPPRPPSLLKSSSMAPVRSESKKHQPETNMQEVMAALRSPLSFSSNLSSSTSQHAHPPPRAATDSHPITTTISLATASSIADKIADLPPPAGLEKVHQLAAAISAAAAEAAADAAQVTTAATTNIHSSDAVAKTQEPSLTFPIVAPAITSPPPPSLPQAHTPASPPAPSAPALAPNAPLPSPPKPVSSSSLSAPSAPPPASVPPPSPQVAPGPQPSPPAVIANLFAIPPSEGATGHHGRNVSFQSPFQSQLSPLPPPPPEAAFGSPASSVSSPQARQAFPPPPSSPVLLPGIPGVRKPSIFIPATHQAGPHPSLPIAGSTPTISPQSGPTHIFIPVSGGSPGETARLGPQLLVLPGHPQHPMPVRSRSPSPVREQRPRYQEKRGEVNPMPPPPAPSAPPQERTEPPPSPAPPPAPKHDPPVEPKPSPPPPPPLPPPPPPPQLSEAQELAAKMVQEENRNMAAHFASPHRNRISRLVAEVDKRRKEGQELAVRLDERSKVQKMSIEDLEKYLGNKSDIVVQFRKLQQLKNSLGGKPVAELGESLINSAREVQASAVEAAIVSEIEKDEMRQVILEQEKILADTVQEMKLSLRLADHQGKSQGMGAAANAWMAGHASALDTVAQSSRSGLIDSRLLPRTSDPSNFLRSLHSTFLPGSPQYLTGQTLDRSSQPSMPPLGAEAAFESRRRSKSASPTRHHHHSTTNVYPYPHSPSPSQPYVDERHGGGDLGQASVDNITRTARDVASQLDDALRHLLHPEGRPVDRPPQPPLPPAVFSPSSLLSSPLLPVSSLTAPPLPSPTLDPHKYDLTSLVPQLAPPLSTPSNLNTYHPGFATPSLVPSQGIADGSQPGMIPMMPPNPALAQMMMTMQWPGMMGLGPYPPPYSYPLPAFSHPAMLSRNLSPMDLASSGLWAGGLVGATVEGGQPQASVPSFPSPPSPPVPSPVHSSYQPHPAATPNPPAPIPSVPAPEASSPNPPPRSPENNLLSYSQALSPYDSPSPAPPPSPLPRAMASPPRPPPPSQPPVTPQSVSHQAPPVATPSVWPAASYQSLRSPNFQPIAQFQAPAPAPAPAKSMNMAQPLNSVLNAAPLMTTSVTRSSSEQPSRFDATGPSTSSARTLNPPPSIGQVAASAVKLLNEAQGARSSLATRRPVTMMAMREEDKFYETLAQIQAVYKPH